MLRLQVRQIDNTVRPPAPFAGRHARRAAHARSVPLDGDSLRTLRDKKPDFQRGTSQGPKFGALRYRRAITPPGQRPSGP